MGHGYIKKCTHCGHKVEIYKGIGMMDYYGYYLLPPSNEESRWREVISSKRILKEIENIIVNYQGTLYKENDEETQYDYYIYGWDEYYSEQEKKIYNLFHFKLEYVDNGIKKIYEPTYFDKHRNPLRLLKDDDIVEDVCPKCNNEYKDLIYSIVNWD